MDTLFLHWSLKPSQGGAAATMAYRKPWVNLAKSGDTAFYHWRANIEWTCRITRQFAVHITQCGTAISSNSIGPANVWLDRPDLTWIRHPNQQTNQL
jgi:hypothetical protein